MGAVMWFLAGFASAIVLAVIAFFGLSEYLLRQPGNEDLIRDRKHAPKSNS